MKNSNGLLSKSLKLSSAFPLLLVMALSGCGGPVKDPADNAAEDGVVDGVGPYGNFHPGDVGGNHNFAELINNYAQAKPKKPAWAAYWWPYTGNGIAAGTYDGGGPHGGGFSPAGKYDAARGGTTHAQDWEVKNHGRGVPKVQGWWGHCNGWCASSALLDEPREAVKVNGITFGVADIKGLLAEAGMSVSAEFFGNRVDPWTASDQRRWEDTIPDQYFLVLTNFMGKYGQSVLIDRFTGDQIWNQPLAGYKMEMPTTKDYLGCSGSVCKINVRSTIWWYNDSGVPATVLSPEFKFQDEVDPGSGAEVVQHRVLDMEVWLDGPVEFDANGKIMKSGNVIVTRDTSTAGDFFVGGAWRMGNYNVDANPDYMWVPYSHIKPDATDDYANPYMDIAWIKEHLLVPGGADDTSVRPSPVATAPSPTPSPSPSPSSTPSSTPSGSPSHSPVPGPTPTPTHHYE